MDHFGRAKCPQHFCQHLMSSLSLLIITLAITTACVLAISKKSSYRYVDTSRGPRTITSVPKTIQADQSSVFRVLCDYTTWSQWISPASAFKSIASNTVDKPRLGSFQEVGDSCDEIFGLQGSRIRWKVREFIPEKLLTVYSSESEGTFGWDELEMSFELDSTDKTRKDTTQLAFTYSWTVPNPFVSVIEKLFIRQSMINDNQVALDKLAKLCNPSIS